MRFYPGSSNFAAAVEPSPGTPDPRNKSAHRVAVSYAAGRQATAHQTAAHQIAFRRIGGCTAPNSVAAHETTLHKVASVAFPSNDFPV